MVLNYMPFNIKTFKGELKQGGARACLFEVFLSLPPTLLDLNAGGVVNFPDWKLAGDKLRFMCKGSSIPSSSVGVIEIPYQGRKIKTAGSKTFEPWTITVINDEDFIVRKAMEHWIAAMNGHSSNMKNSGVTSSMFTYQGEGQVIQYSQGPISRPIRTYNFANVFPSEVSAIEVNWANADDIEEFSVTLQYDYWEANEGGSF